ncbi:hypothetical protein NEIMUCOT_04083 [Neisseria mucosa ATCC 25996]|uniref:Uncharacterized protein n=1 Tax=Neisseria mucosa (strain ATCC 25996 / DSM 4631 / NCTC 10774 / M26) TaxID=546266 RepID=D2ZTZ5_NEIM2|nr:hypothetical protein NEIMUCOT_04083 [Neisseria mucosa ATCC 25996]
MPPFFVSCVSSILSPPISNYSGLNLNQDKSTKPQTVQIVRQGEATPYWFKVNSLYLEVFGHSARITSYEKVV